MKPLLPALLLALAADAAPCPGQPAAWPAITNTMRPWTRWWWLGSGVDRPNLDRMLRQLHDAGEGGVEICPIYGAKGYESRFVPYLSPAWLDLLAGTTRTAAALGMGVDLTTGTGWPMGGPWIPDEQASENAVVRKIVLGADGTPGESLVPRGSRAPAAPAASGRPGGPAMDGLVDAGRLRLRILCARAVSAAGDQVDLTGRISPAGELLWKAPGPGWTLYEVVGRQPMQKVKRSAPGDEGNVIDPYSLASLETFLSRFDTAFAHFHGASPRAEFHDSFEYFGADWTPPLFAEFQRRRGYDLREHLPSLAGDGDPTLAAEVREDYRRTIAELHRDWVAAWTAWSHRQGSLSREQAHGAPANIEDVYAAADIPETEGAFGGGDDSQLPMLKFASSAAHVTGKPLASSETFTWLGEHFSVPLSALKPVADRFFLAGINHLFFHGTPYSPADAPWPGWLFYASVNFGPNGGIFRDLPAFNAYATRVQSILQGGRPDNDVLLYFPVADFWQTNGGPLLVPFKTPGLWMKGSAFAAAADELWRRGYAYDEITDDLLAGAKAEGRSILLPGGARYQALVVPAAHFLPVATLRRLAALAAGGATVVFQDRIPSAVPGLPTLDGARALGALASAAGNRFIVTARFADALQEHGVRRETMREQGVDCIRRLRADGGTDYFVANRTSRDFEGWLPFGTPFAAAVLMDPEKPSRIGRPALAPDGAATEVYLQLAAGDSLILRTARNGGETSAAPDWRYGHPDEAARRAVGGPWRVTFLTGGPVLPRAFSAERLASWTGQDDPEAKRFAGTAVYRTHFSVERAEGPYRLDLGQVADSARVRLNGRDLGILWRPPFALVTADALRSGDNQLEVEVTNLAANRIADLDRRHVAWKSFYEINFVNRDYEPFDASEWPLRPSGLLGPVTLTPLRPFAPAPLSPQRRG